MVDQDSAAKATVRQRLRAARVALTQEQRQREHQRIVTALQKRCVTASVLASYLALPEEVDLDPLHRWWWSTGQRLWLPRVAGPGMLTWHPLAGLHQTRSGYRGIREPDPALCPAAALPAEAWVLVPGIGFTNDGERLGQGGGFYDRLLAIHRAPTIGVAYACQRCAALPVEAHDQRVSEMIFGG